MANYSAKVDVIIAGMRKLDILGDRLQTINNTIDTLNKKRVALNVGGRGAERDLSGELSKGVNDYVRDWVNGNKQIGKSLADVSQQTQAFQQLLAETAMAGSDPKQAAAIKNLASAWADTTKAAGRYETKLTDIQRAALGLQTQAKRDEEVYRRLNAIQSRNFQERQKQTAEQEAAQKRQAKNQRAESIALGVGFPMMFGAGPGSIAGSLAGSFVGSGFGGQILGGAFGQVLDDAAKSAADFARSMREGGDAAGYLTEKLGYLNPETKALIQNAQQSGQTAVAAALAQKELANAIGGQAASDLKNYGELWDFTGRQFQKFTLLLQAGMPQIIAQTLAAATGLTGLYAIVSRLPLVAGLAGMVAPKEKPQTVEAQTRSKELQEQLNLARANYQVTLQNNTANSQGYLISKAQTIQIEKQNKYEEIMRDLKAKKFSDQDKILKVLALEVNTQEKLRNLEIERVQLIQQRNQAALAQAQAGMEVGIIQQQVRLAQEQNTASEVRRTSLQGQIGIQQALNRLESINLQIAQERANTQRDINNNKIKELEAQRSIATAQVDLAQAQAAQQQQQSMTSAYTTALQATIERLTIEKNIRTVQEQQLELTGTAYELYAQQNKNIKENYYTAKNILDLETNIALAQNPASAMLINDTYQKRLSLLQQEYTLQEALQKQRVLAAQAERSKLLLGGKLDSAAREGDLTKTLGLGKIDIAMRGQSEGRKEKAVLQYTIEAEQLQRQVQYTKELTTLEADILVTTGITQENLQIQYEQRLKNIEAEELLYMQIDAVRMKQAELNEFASTYGSLIQGIGSSIESGVVGAIDGAITGAKSLQEVLSDVLKDIGKMLISFGIRSLLSGIDIGGVPLVGRASGGPVSSNSTYMVGEQGPELFVPRTAGTIVPADATAAAMARYQRQGSGSGAGGSGSDAMGAGEATPVLSMSFETTRFMDRDWVDKDQLVAAMAATERRATTAGAKAGAAQVSSQMRNSPGYRRQVGLR